MFEQLYQVPSALARHLRHPFVEERRRFLIHLAERGYPPRELRATASLLLNIIDVLDLVNRPVERISLEEIAQKCAPRKTKNTLAVRWIRFLDRLEISNKPVHPYVKEIDAFVKYMRCERGAAESTIKFRSQFLRRFLAQIQPPTGQLCEFTVTRIDEALLAMVNQKGYSRNSVCSWASTLRAFFRFGATQKWCPRALADSITRPRRFAQESLPSAPSWDDVQRLLKMTEGDRPTDIRDRAILMLFAIYGLRAGEVRQLTLDNFNWEQERLTVVSSKAGRTRSFPLIHSVGDAVIRYLQEVRPRSAHREIFLTMNAPTRPIRAAMCDIVSTRLKTLGVSLRHYGPHALRHACAVHLQDCGLSLKEIGDHLGHQHPDTTRIYAKVNRAALRQVADFDLGGLL